MEKYCLACEQTKPCSEFYRRGTGFQTNCKVCKSRIDKEYNLATDKKRKRKKERDKELKDWVNSYKADKGCAYCSEREPLFLDFHHFGDDKEFCVSMIRRRSRKVIEAEIKKCVVVCCRCHRMIHAGWNGPWKFLPSPPSGARTSNPGVVGLTPTEGTYL